MLRGVMGAPSVTQHRRKTTEEQEHLPPQDSIDAERQKSKSIYLHKTVRWGAQTGFGLAGKAAALPPL